MSEQEAYGASSCKASCPAELYESRGMTPYDVLIDTVVLHWLAPFTGGIIVSFHESNYRMHCTELSSLPIPNDGFYRLSSDRGGGGG